MAEPITIYKLIILYMLSQVDFPLGNTKISNFFLDKEYTTYFTIQQVLNDLLDSELIVAESTHNNTNYRITASGRETLDFFEDKISEAIRQDICEYFSQNQIEMKKVPITTALRNITMRYIASSDKKIFRSLI